MIEIVSLSLNLMMVTAWVLFRNILVDDEIREWSTTTVLILGYVVSLVNIYMVYYFFKVYLFFQRIMISKNTLNSRLFCAFTITLSVFTLISIFELCIITPTLNYFIQIEY